MNHSTPNAGLVGETISVETIQQVRLWMKALGCTEAELRFAVRAVGHSVEAVQAFLDRAR